LSEAKTWSNASNSFFQLLCFDVTVTTTFDKTEMPREILSALDRNAYTTSRPRMGDSTHVVTVTLTFLNNEECREHFRKLLFRLRLEFGKNVIIQGKGKYHNSATY
jgi:hypothetical protein